MMRSAPLLLLALLSSVPAWAADDVAENHLVDAAVAYDAQDWDAALAAIDKASAEVESAGLEARIERQRALVLAAVDRPTEALEAFRAALALDPELPFEGWRFGPGVNSLFECAKRLDPSDPPVERLRADGRRGWICPDPDALSAVEPPAPPPGAPVAPGPDIGAEAPAPAASSGRLSAGGAIGITLLAAGLGAGGGIGVWQLLASGDSQSRGDDLRALPVEASTDTQGRLRQINAAYADANDQESVAVIALSAGAGAAAVGLVMLLVDLGTPGGSDADALGWRLVPTGPGSAALSVEF